VEAWAVSGVELPYGDDPSSWWIEEGGALLHRPVAEAEPLPGKYVLPGLVDAHAHPTIAMGPAGPWPLDDAGTRANLVAWAEIGVCLVRDVGSAGGRALEIRAEPGAPIVQAAGRFLAPSGRYFPDLLPDPVSEDELIAAAVIEIGRGARWVKVIADFPDLVAGSEAEPTYSIERITEVVAVAHQLGARVAVHSTVANVGFLVGAGVDSIEHGTSIDDYAIADMAQRRTAWTPTLSAMNALIESSGTPPSRRQTLLERRDRLRELLPLATRLGVPVLAGTDVTGTLPREVTLLAQMGLEPTDAIAAASVWPRKFLGIESHAADLVTYHHDPRVDPTELARPAAVVVQGKRIR
jgi:imidazolonepropionase-like amidohydrolase